MQCSKRFFLYPILLLLYYMFLLPAIFLSLNRSCRKCENDMNLNCGVFYSVQRFFYVIVSNFSLIPSAPLRFVVRWTFLERKIKSFEPKTLWTISFSDLLHTGYYIL